jgi:hypothetical protein
MSHAASRHLLAVTLPFVLLALAPSVSAQKLLRSDNGFLAIDDAEITPDQRYAVFRQNNADQSALVFDLATGQLAAAPGTSSSYGLMGECLDGVAVTNTRAVVLGTRALILDLTNLVNPIVSANLAGYHPRDVVLTPDGTIACVRGGSTEPSIPGMVGGQYLFDLATGAQIGFQPGEPNPYPYTTGDPLVFNVDGVEATNAHAVMLSFIDHGAGTPEARVTIWELHPSGGGPPTVAFETSTTAGTRDQAGAPYDLAITPDGTKAVVRSELETGLYDLSVSPPAVVWLRACPGPYLQEALDAVEATNDRIVTISRFDSHRGHAAQVDVFDMLGNDHFEVIPGSPHDLAITPNGGRAIVRTNSHVFLYDIVNLSGGTALTALSRAAAPSVSLQYFGGLDSAVATDRFAATLSRAENLQNTNVYFWDISGPALVEIAMRTIPHTRPIDLALTPDGRKLAVAGNSNVSVYDLATGAQLFTHDTCPPNAFYPWCDGVTASADRVVANGQYGPQSGWIAIVDIARFAENYCVGAPNSTGAGAGISAAGTASVGANDLKLFATDMPSGMTARFYYGASAARTPFGNGYQCVGGTRYMLPSFRTNEAGAGWVAVNYGALPAGGQITPGSTWRFQCVYRDPAAGGANANTTDALRIVFGP